MSYLGHLLREILTSAEMQSVYSTAPADWDVISRTLVSGVLPLCRDAVCILQTQPTEMSYPGHLLREILPLCRDAVGVFYSPSRLDKLLLDFNKSNIFHTEIYTYKYHYKAGRHVYSSTRLRTYWKIFSIFINLQDLSWKSLKSSISNYSFFFLKFKIDIYIQKWYY